MPRKEVIKALRQMLLPGFKEVRGVEPVPGMPSGTYYVDPTKLSERKWLDQNAKRLFKEGELAEQLHGDARSANMLGGALDVLRRGTQLPGIGKYTRGIVRLDDNGRVIGGAAVDTAKGAEYGIEGDPAYLEYIATVSPDVKGRDLMGAMQDVVGDDVVFQVATPEVNAAKYEQWGAAPMAKRGGLDALGGDEQLPAYRLKKHVKSVKPKAKTKLPAGQQPLFEKE